MLTTDRHGLLRSLVPPSGLSSTRASHLCRPRRVVSSSPPAARVDRGALCLTGSRTSYTLLAVPCGTRPTVAPTLAASPLPSRRSTGAMEAVPARAARVSGSSICCPIPDAPCPRARRVGIHDTCIVARPRFAIPAIKRRPPTTHPFTLWMDRTPAAAARASIPDSAFCPGAVPWLPCRVLGSIGAAPTSPRVA